MIESKEINNPFPGLRPFETEEYELFFGREGQSDALISRLQRSHFLAVVGTSGSGKSSLVRAGLLPALRGGMMAGAGSGWRIAIMRPGSDPIGNLAIALADKDVLLEAGGGLSDAEAEAVIEATLRRGSLGLVDVTRQARLAEHEKLLVVVDQFEELFRFRAARASSSTGDDASAFVKLLLEASQQSEVSIYVVPTMRSDFLGDCAQFQGLPEAINDGQYLIPRMTRDERRFAITGPVGVTRGKITEPLINRLMNDVGDNPDQLPILQHALMRTWYYWAAHRRNGDGIGLEHYEAIGTMSDALSLHADEAYEQLPQHLLLVCEILFKSLTERGADNREIRRPTRLKDICEIAGASAADVIAVVEVFREGGCSFLMPPTGVPLQPETIIDISHESLIRNWDRLKKWVNEEAQSARIYRRLAEAAVLHREGSEGLLQDPALQIALDWRDKSKPNAAWAAHYHPEFDESLAYLEKSRVARDAARAERERERQLVIERERRELEMARDFAEKQTRSAHRMRWLTAGMAVMFLLSLVTAGYALSARRDTERERARVAAALENTDRQRKEIEETLQRKNEADLARVAAEAGKQEAQAGEKEALAKALTAKAHAEKEAKRANTQAAIAAKNLRDTLEATTAGSSVVRRAIPIVSHSDLVRRGIEAQQREELDEALLVFDQLRAQLEAVRQGSTNQPARNLTIGELREFAATIGKLESFTMQLGWTHSNIGAARLKSNDFPAAIESYEKALKIFDQLPESGNERILLETYQGLAQAYHAVAMSGRPQRGKAVPYSDKSREDFQKAEDFDRRAVAFQERFRQDKPAEVAEGYLNLARLYQDYGKVAEAEATFKRAIELRRLRKTSSELDSNQRAALASAHKELAELYQVYGRQDDAVRVLNEMVILQEDVTVYDLAEQGQEIANAYSDLGQLYSAKGEAAIREAAIPKKSGDAASELKADKEAALYKKKADNAYRTANILQRAGIELRRAAKYQGDRTGPEWLNLVKDLTLDLDELGDAYARMGKFTDAEAIYQTSFEYREGTPDEWKSYHKLRAFYLEQKEYGQAENYSKLLIEAYKTAPRSEKYIDALVLLAAVYAADPNKHREAEEVYNRALDIATAQDDWQYPNHILYGLGQLYLKQKKTDERGKAIMRRLDVLTRFFKRLPDPDRRPRAPINLVSEYLNAVQAAAFFQSTVRQNNVEAEAAYLPAFTAYDHLTATVFNMKVLENYASTLDDYHNLLSKMNKPAAEVARVKQLSESLKTRLKKLLLSAESSRQPAEVQQSPTQQGAVTPTQ